MLSFIWFIFLLKILIEIERYYKVTAGSVSLDLQVWQCLKIMWIQSGFIFHLASSDLNLCTKFTSESSRSRSLWKFCIRLTKSQKFIIWTILDCDEHVSPVFMLFRRLELSKSTCVFTLSHCSSIVYSLTHNHTSVIQFNSTSVFGGVSLDWTVENRSINL